MLVMGLLGAMSTASAEVMASITWRGFSVRGSGEAHRLYRVLIPALHEIFFETHFAGRRNQTRVSTRESLMGRICAFTSALVADD